MALFWRTEPMNVRKNLFFYVTICFCMLWSNNLSWAQWSVPEPVTEINSSYIDKSPFLSFDGLTMYFSRQSGPGWYYTRIYQATRPTADGPFNSVTEISSLNYFGGHVDSPWVSSDNLRMYYYRTEPGSQSLLKMSQRGSIASPWPEGANINELNALGSLAGPTLTVDELTIVFSGSNIAGGLGGHDLWQASRTSLGNPFGSAVNLTGINTTASEYHPSLSSDGLTLYFVSNRNGTTQLFKATRPALNFPFSTPEVLTEFESPGAASDYPFISSDGGTFYYTQDFGDGRDIYVSYNLGEPNIDPNTTAGDYYVDAATGNDFNNGTSPFTPFATIQRGLNAAQNGQVVIVAAGTYVGTGNKNLTFAGRSVILRSDAGPQTTIIDCQGNGQGFIFQSGEGQGTVVNGFTITNGNHQNGGGIYCQGASPRIVNCIIANNQGSQSGGIYCTNFGNPTFTNCHIVSNTGSLGGGVRLAQSEGVLMNCVIAGNTSQNPGAGIKCDFGNTSPVITNCTITANSSGSYGGGLLVTFTSASLHNSIVWNNVGTTGAQIAVDTGGSLTATYCDVQGGQAGVYTNNGTLNWGSGNRDEDPLFVDAGNGDFHLKSNRGRYWPAQDVWVLDALTSPGIDAGDPMDNILDEPVPNGSVVNLGAYGGTHQASLSLDSGGQPLQGDVNGDGLVDITDLFQLIDQWLNQFGDTMGDV